MRTEPSVLLVLSPHPNLEYFCVEIVRGFEKGLASHSTQNTTKNISQSSVLLLISMQRKKRTEKRLEFMVWEGFPCANPLCPPTPSQRALRDRLMSRGKNCLPTVSRQFLTRNYPRPNRLLKCLPNCLSPTREGLFILFQNYPRGEGNCETSERQKLSRGNFCPGTSRCLAEPTGLGVAKEKW